MVKKTWWVITDFWMLPAVCTEMQETWCDSKTGHGKNCTLFAFSNVANGRHDDPVLLPKNEGFINIHIKCAGQASQKTVIVYAE